MDDNKSNQPTPDQLIKMLKLQLGAERNPRKPQQANNRAVIWGSLVIILAAGLALLWFILSLLEEFKQSNLGQKPKNKTQQTKF